MTMLPFEDDQVSLDGENTSDEPVTDAAGQVVTADDDDEDKNKSDNPGYTIEEWEAGVKDAPLTAADLAHAKHAAAVATGQASVAPPPIDAPKQRNRRKDAGKPRKPKSGDPVSAEMLAAPEPEPEPRITGHQEIISTSDAQVIIDHKAGQALYVGNKEPGIPCDLAPGKVVVADDFPGALAENDRAYCADMRKLARRRLKSVARFATRASEISRMWPRNPDGFFAAAIKLSDDIERFSETNAAHAMHAATLCTKLFPKDTLNVLTMSELVFAQ